MINIDPNTTFSTGNVAKMLNVEGLNASRVKLLCAKGLVPCTTNETGSKTHYHVRFGDFESVLAAHAMHRSVGRNVPKHPSMEQHAELESRVELLEGILNDILIRLPQENA